MPRDGVGPSLPCISVWRFYSIFSRLLIDRFLLPCLRWPIPSVTLIDPKAFHPSICASYAWAEQIRTSSQAHFGYLVLYGLVESITSTQLPARTGTSFRGHCRARGLNNIREAVKGRLNELSPGVRVLRSSLNRVRQTV